MELHSQRLRLEPLEPHHAELLFNGLQSASLYHFIADTPPQSVEALRQRYTILARRRSPDGKEIWLNWAVWSFPENRYIGYVQATVAEEDSVIAYVFFPDVWGKGYAREAVSRAIEYLSETYQTIELCAYVDPRNRRSISLLHDLGFSLVAIRRNAEQIQGMWTDEAEYRRYIS